MGGGDRPGWGDGYFHVCHPGHCGQVVIAGVKDPHGNVAHRELLGQLKAHAHLLEGQTFKPEMSHKPMRTPHVIVLP